VVVHPPPQEPQPLSTVPQPLTIVPQPPQPVALPQPATLPPQGLPQALTGVDGTSIVWHW
jgi:hypothetical protein